MKKSLIAFAVLLAAICSAFLCGCSRAVEHTCMTYSSGGSAVTDIEISLGDRIVAISPSPDGEVHIDYYDSDTERLDISLTDGTLKVSLVYQKHWTDYIGIQTAAEYRTVKVLLPDSVISDLSVSTTNENIYLSRLRVLSSLSAECNGGSICLDTLHAARELCFDVKNGSLSGVISGCIDDFMIRCEIKKGNSNLPSYKDCGEKYLYARCNNGDINISFAD